MTESRRKFINRFVFLSTSLAGSMFLLPSCGEGESKPDPPKTDSSAKAAAPADPCKDFTGVPQEELDKRKSMGYVEKSPLPESSCGNCGLYIPLAEKKECGRCLLFKGPVYADGHCLQWVAKTQG